MKKTDQCIRRAGVDRIVEKIGYGLFDGVANSGKGISYLARMRTNRNRIDNGKVLDIHGACGNLQFRMYPTQRSSFNCLTMFRPASLTTDSRCSHDSYERTLFEECQDPQGIDSWIGNNTVFIATD